MQTEEARLRELVARLQDQLAEAREVIAFYEAGGERAVDDDPTWMDIGHVFKMQKRVAQFVALLYESRHVVSNETCIRLLWDDKETEDWHDVKVAACKARKHLGGVKGIVLVPRVGYRLTDYGRALVRRKLATLDKVA